MLIENILLVGFATAALSRLIVHERGPWGVLARFRIWLTKGKNSEMVQMVSCGICTGFWIALILAAFVWLWPGLRGLLFPFAALGVAYVCLGMTSLYSGPGG